MDADRVKAAEVWRRLPYHVGSSDLHFSLSDALVRHASEPTLWWHATDRPTLILGTGQTRDQIDIEACTRLGADIVRRTSGGMAVFAAAGVLGLDVALPIDHPLASSDIVEAYRWLGEVWVDATRILGVDSRLVSVQEARAGRETASQRSPVEMACFGTMSPYEVAVGNRKLVGLAQVRRRAGVLLQAGIHLHFEPKELASLLAVGCKDEFTDGLRHAAVGLDEAAPTLYTASDVMEIFCGSLERRLGVRLVPSDWTTEEWRHAALS